MEGELLGVKKQTHLSSACATRCVTVVLSKPGKATSLGDAQVTRGTGGHTEGVHWLNPRKRQ